MRVSVVHTSNYASVQCSFYLTYHKFATKEQQLACYPQFPQFLEAKLRYDPHQVFQSDWYRHYRRLLEAE